MDPFTALIVAAVLSDVFTGGWVHRKLAAAVRGEAKPRPRSWTLPTLTRPGGAPAPAPAGGVSSGGGALPRPARPDRAPAAAAPVQAAPAQTRTWLWVWGWMPREKTPGAGRPTPPRTGARPVVRPGGRPGEPPTLAGPRPGVPGRVTRPRPHPAPTGAAGPAPWGDPALTPGHPGEPDGAPAPPHPGAVPGAGGVPPLTLVPPLPPGPPTSPRDTPGIPTPDPTEPPQEATVSVDVATPNTTTEDVPAHIDAGLQLATAVEDVAEQWVQDLNEAIRRHIASAEGIKGFPPSLMGRWEDDVASPIKQARDLIAAAAEGARGIADAERDALMPSVEAADSAPADSDLTQSSLRTS